uniref:Uncharacterized protein S10SEA n=1 Tax=Ipomoea trifida TaxID=35884 RepID=A4PHP5_IPOTF|nr:hypothetical protein [Ipomoea trifida]
MTQKVLVKPSPPPLEDDSNDYVRYRVVLPYLLVIGIINAIAAVLFKMKFIDGPGFSRACWTLMLLGSDVLNSTELRNVVTLLIAAHICMNSLGLACWIVFDVNEYKMKNKWPSIELLFETGVWLFMVSLGMFEYISRIFTKEEEFIGLYCWYPVAVAFGSMIANYWTNLRKTSADRLKPQLIDKAENTFDELIRTFIEEPQNDNINKFDQTLADFTRMLSIIVAQQQEALEIAEQQEARSEAAECGNTACQSL